MQFLASFYNLYCTYYNYNLYRFKLKKIICTGEMLILSTMLLDSKNHISMHFIFYFDIWASFGHGDLIKYHFELSRLSIDHTEKNNILVTHSSQVGENWVQFYIIQQISCQISLCILLLLWEVFGNHFGTDFSHYEIFS